MHPPSFGGFAHHAKKIKDGIAKLNKIKHKEALKKSIEAIKQASAEAMERGDTEGTQKPIEPRHVAKHLKKSIEALKRKHEEHKDNLKKGLEAIKKSMAGLKNTK